MSKKFDNLGWFVAVALAGTMFGAGFKAPGDKIGTVDINKVFRDSDYAKKQSDTLNLMGTTRKGIMDLVNQYPVMKPEDAQMYKQLSLKDNPTADDKLTLDRLTTAAKDADTQYRALTTKSSPTPAELTQMEAFNNRKDQNTKLLQNWRTEFENDLQTLREKVQADASAKVRDCVAQVAKDQGYSVVFVTEVAPYGANDLTDAALKQMAKK